MSEHHLHKFTAYGIELEYMIVDRKTLAVSPIADRVLAALAGGESVSYVEGEDVSWSNELVLHVIEAKTNGPKGDLPRLMGDLQREVVKANRIAESLGSMLLPTAMHPFFNPEADQVLLWPHDDATIYNTYNKIFDCRGHGWANLQSVHINLPFYDDDEFGRVHTAIRTVLPLIGPLAASSPIVAGRYTEHIDNRLAYYKSNQRKIPTIIGKLIPEPVVSRREYEDTILKPMFRDVAPFDPEGIIQHEWLNSRAAIARFMRSAIEIRLVDIQECVRADMAVVALIVSLIEALDRGLFGDLKQHLTFSSERLHQIFQAGIKAGMDGVIDDEEYATIFGARGDATFRELWQVIYDQLKCQPDLKIKDWHPEIDFILKHGNLSSRIIKCLGRHPSREQVAAIYGRLNQCLIKNEMFDPAC